MSKSVLYAKLLKEYITLPVWLIIIISAIMFTLMVICLKIKYRKMAIFSLIGGLILSVAVYVTSILPFQRDIQEEAFITYSGEFYVEECYSLNRGGTYILIRYGEENESVRYKVLCDVTEVENETGYNGTFVYSQHSKCLVEIELQAN